MKIQPIWSYIFDRVEPLKRSLYTILRDNPLFNTLTRRELISLTRIVHERTYQKEEIIFQENEIGAGMYIIKNGSVRIVEKKKDEISVVLATLNDRQFFGELALVDNSPRMATAVANENTEIIGFYQPDLMELLERNPRMGSKILFKLVQFMGMRLKTNNMQLRILQEKMESRKETDHA